MTIWETVFRTTKYLNHIYANMEPLTQDQRVPGTLGFKP